MWVETSFVVGSLQPEHGGEVLGVEAEVLSECVKLERYCELPKQ